MMVEAALRRDLHPGVRERSFATNRPEQKLPSDFRLNVDSKLLVLDELGLLLLPLEGDLVDEVIGRLVVVADHLLLRRQRFVVQHGRLFRHRPDLIAEKFHEVFVVVGYQAETRTQELGGPAVVMKLLVGEGPEVGEVLGSHPLPSGKGFDLVERVLKR